MADYSTVNPITTREEIWGTLEPYDGFDYPVVHSQYSLGGLTSVASITSTNPPVAMREEGFMVFQESNSRYYMYNAQGQWDIVDDDGGSNGLYNYNKSIISGATVEMYKWDNGNLEYFIAMPSTKTGVANGNIWYNSSATVTFPVPFKTFDDMYALAAGKSTGTGQGFASVSTLTTTQVRLYVCGTHSNTYAIGNVSVYGTWK